MKGNHRDRKRGKGRSSIQQVFDQFTHGVVISILLCTTSIAIAGTAHAASNNIIPNPISIGIRSALVKNRTPFGTKRGGSSNNYFGGTSTSRDDYWTASYNKNEEHRDGYDYDDYDYDDLQSDYFSDGEQKEQKRCILVNNRSIVRQPSSTSTSTPTIAAEKTESSARINTQHRGGAALTALNFWENMICGAVSRSIAQTATHPANTMKTLLQANRDAATRMKLTEIARPENFKLLTRGAGAQFCMSIPHGAVNFAVLEYVRKSLHTVTMRSKWASEKQETSAAFGPAMDFLSSAIATVCCSVISTPQMMVVDNIMAGTYTNLFDAFTGLSKNGGILGFYTGWWPGLAGKIPSYALTWTLFQQLKLAQLRISQRPPKDYENSIMGCLASTITVSIMIPMDTIKTRLVTQMNYPDLVPYKGIIDAAVRITKEEGIGTFYRGLPPRLISVVPMIGIQFGVYEFMKKVMVSRHEDGGAGGVDRRDKYRIEEVMLEVAADDDQPFPVPVMGGNQMSKPKKQKKMRGAKK